MTEPYYDPMEREEEITKEEFEVMDESPDICGICGEPGADKFKHPCHWPGELNPEGDLVHAECEQAECKRAFQEFSARVGDDGVREFLRRNA